MVLIKTRLFVYVCLSVICLTSIPLLAQQFLETRIAELDRQEKYAEALALCEKNIDLSVAAYFAGEYTYHGRKGIQLDVPKGEAHFLKALDRLLPRAKEGDALTAAVGITIHSNMKAFQNYSFLFSESSQLADSALFAHEFGHNFGFAHNEVEFDWDNLMKPGRSGTRLRYFQWKQINGKKEKP